jgi:hypothetical protein
MSSTEHKQMIDNKTQELEEARSIAESFLFNAVFHL